MRAIGPLSVVRPGPADQVVGLSPTTAQNWATVSVQTSGNWWRPRRATASQTAVTAFWSCTKAVPARPRADPTRIHGCQPRRFQSEVQATFATIVRQGTVENLPTSPIASVMPIEQISGPIVEPASATRITPPLASSATNVPESVAARGGLTKVAGNHNHRPPCPSSTAPRQTAVFDSRKTGAPPFGRFSRHHQKCRGSAARRELSAPASGRTRCRGRAHRIQRIQVGSRLRRLLGDLACTRASPLVGSGSPLLVVSTGEAWASSLWWQAGLICHSHLSTTRNPGEPIACAPGRRRRAGLLTWAGA